MSEARGLTDRGRIWAPRCMRSGGGHRTPAEVRALRMQLRAVLSNGGRPP
ncbi:MAG: hypothetical protein JWP46_1189, partial [Modestobacter sp.]|nr:hypothetical protein [Modestobacter sp.]